MLAAVRPSRQIAVTPASNPPEDGVEAVYCGVKLVDAV